MSTSSNNDSYGSSNSSNSSNTSNSTNSDESVYQYDWTGHIINNKYVILGELGHGSYCTVWSGYDIDTKNLIALKIYNIDDTEDGKNEKILLDKIKNFNLPNVVLYNKCFDYTLIDKDKNNEEDIEEQYFIMVMDHCGYSLNEIKKLFRDIIKTNKEINLNYILFINKVKDIIIDILNKLHIKGYAHTDIKPENILTDIPKLETTLLYEQIKLIHNKNKKQKNNKILQEISKLIHDYSNEITNEQVIDYLTNFNYNVKLCDFGTCLEFNDDTIYKKHTSYYKSPKIILKYPLDITYDYWSLGCSIYELLSGEVLFNPFDEELIALYDDIEDINLIYLISCCIGLPPNDMINKSKIKDVLFTFDNKCIRGFRNIKYNNFINKILDLETDLNKKILYDLIIFMIKHITY
jgi:serine/threonine protein kinase